MRIAMIGTRGVPARYGGFETAIEEVGSRLAARGHEVLVYCRGDDRSPEHLGMQRLRLPAVHHPAMETLSHTGLSVVDVLRRKVDAAILFNAANSVLLPVLKLGRIPVAVHVDGLEWKRAKWGPNGRRWYLANERLAVRWGDDLISDAAGIQDYYRERYDTGSVMIPYGAPILDGFSHEKLAEIGLQAGGFHVVVARMEPENHVDVIVEGYLASAARLPLVVVGSVPYPSDHERHVQELAARDERVRLLGGVWDQDLLNALYAGSASYVHGHSVGGTNPSLLRAMGAGAAVTAWDVNFNREVLGETGVFFADATEAAKRFVEVEDDATASAARGVAARQRASERYRWDDVATAYEQLCEGLAARRRRTA